MTIRDIGKYIVIILFIVALYFLFTYESVIEYGPGVKVPDIPLQSDIKNPQTFEFKEHTITPLAEYNIRAKILSIETYSSGREAELSPIDLALGWGKMSDESVLENINIRQARRWYYWRTNRLPIPKNEIEISSCNVHIIPADDVVEDQLEGLVIGQIINLKGYLVAVKGKDNFQWKSSLSREDTGNHACEIMFVKEVSIPVIPGTVSEY